jgi:hypothetical protein
MRRILALSLIVLTASGNSTVGQQTQPPASPAAASAPANQAPETAPPPPNTLLDGTAVKMRLGENLSSETSKTGDQVPFEVTEEITIEGTVVIPKGAQALATITNAEPKKRMGRGGKLDVNVDSVRLADGEKAQLRAAKDTNGGGHVGAMTGAIVATSLVFFPAAPLFLFMHGKSVEIPKGTEVTAFVQGDMKLDMAKFAPQPQPAAAVVAAIPSGLTIDASIPNCDIEVDGSFVGNTPSSLNLASGQHTIMVKKAGYKDWTRTINVTGGTVRVSADMAAAQ